MPKFTSIVGTILHRAARTDSAYVLQSAVWPQYVTAVAETRTAPDVAYRICSVLAAWHDKFKKVPPTPTDLVHKYRKIAQECAETGEEVTDGGSQVGILVQAMFEV